MFYSRFFSMLLLTLFSVLVMAQDNRTIRVGVLQFGTVNWELATIQQQGFAQRRGIDLKITPLASNHAINVALQGGEVDVIVNDWIWVSRQRAEQRLFSFVPYSLSVGGLMVKPDAHITQLSELKGKKLGIAGGAVDKSWLLFRAYSHKVLGQDLIQLVTPVYGAPPLLNELMRRGELDAVINFWHYNAELQAAGYSPLLSTNELLPELGITTPVPLLGWVFHEQWATEHRGLLLDFLQASYQAKHYLKQSDQAWLAIREIMKTENPNTLLLWRDQYRAGIVQQFGEKEQAAAQQLFAILAQYGGSDLVGEQATLSAGTFWPEFTIPSLDLIE
ncbi:ABC transporter substrate-binding protein [Thioflexithrix psekupsensis]|uniref:ABC transporter substrate-binding protein n=1 Tax=Thioflexithrix psekupsensis TaxID=1570016 RepID=A0A251XCS9_9GAMM|nr:transporter substrate-binding domain-containing protein [Thioflexithrix psekupsensis]OUD15725.1 ABC transporter substrate-binding protein [Thioflexithrix psekupsensis]